MFQIFDPNQWSKSKSIWQNMFYCRFTFLLPNNWSNLATSTSLLLQNGQSWLFTLFYSPTQMTLFCIIISSFHQSSKLTTGHREKTKTAVSDYTTVMTATASASAPSYSLNTHPKWKDLDSSLAFLHFLQISELSLVNSSRVTGLSFYWC